MSGSPIALVNMPFGAIHHPSIQLGVLRSVAASRGLAVDGVYANAPFARRLGWKLYRHLAHTRAPLIGEWLFSRAAFGDAAPPGPFLDHFGEHVAKLLDGTGCSTSDLTRIRDELAPAFIEETARQIARAGYRVVGFTSTFAQNVAALAAARRLKELRPQVSIICGGANYDGEMGHAYLDAFPWLDAVVAGDGEETFPVLAAALLAGEEPPPLPGIVTRRRLAAGEAPGRALYRGPLDGVPTPLYDDYFAALAEHGFFADGEKVDYLPVETSRGCWWGQHHKCKFCGLNALGAEYRMKSKEVVLRQLAELAETHRMSHFAAVDNVAHPRLLGEILDELAGGEYDYRLFFELKSNLSRRQIRRLRNAGVDHAQPGIESFSDHVLGLMSKGVSGLQNVNTLRWFRYYGIEAGWNLLFGFPGETSEDYRTQLDTVRRLRHLWPPQGFSRIWLERFSPYFVDAAQAGFHDLRAPETYRWVYPPELDLERAAYYLEYDVDGTLADEEFEPIRKECDAWQKAWSEQEMPPFLHYEKLFSGIRVVDGRDDPQRPVRIHYRRPVSDAYIHCSEEPRSLASVEAHLERVLGEKVARHSVAGILDRFVQRGLMLSDGSAYLSLALPAYYRL